MTFPEGLRNKDVCHCQLRIQICIGKFKLFFFLNEKTCNLTMNSGRKFVLSYIPKD